MNTGALGPHTGCAPGSNPYPGVASFDIVWHIMHGDRALYQSTSKMYAVSATVVGGEESGQTCLAAHISPNMLHTRL
jgi:hypothetical protein